MWKDINHFSTGRRRVPSVCPATCWRDHHTWGRHPREGSHPHCGLLLWVVHWSVVSPSHWCPFQGASLVGLRHIEDYLVVSFRCVRLLSQWFSPEHRVKEMHFLYHIKVNTKSRGCNTIQFHITFCMEVILSTFCFTHTMYVFLLEAFFSGLLKYGHHNFTLWYEWVA